MYIFSVIFIVPFIMLSFIVPFIMFIIVAGLCLNHYANEEEEYERENSVFNDEPIYSTFVHLNHKSINEKEYYSYTNREQRRADKGRRINSREDRYNYNSVESIMKSKHISNNVNLNSRANRGKKQKHSHKIRSNA